MKNYLKIVFLLVVGTAFAQQESVYSLYNYNMNAINPAYAGADGGKLTFLSRSQWAGVQNAPETQVFILSLPVGEKVGIGLSGVRDQVFIENATSVFIDFSYKLQVAEATDLYFGIKAGGLFLDVDTQSLQTQDQGLSALNEFNPNVGVGAYLKNDKYFVSLSAPRILNTERVSNENGVATTATDKAQFYLSGGYNFDISDKVLFKPSVLGSFLQGLDPTVTVTAAFNFIEKFDLGVNYRTDDALGGFAVINLADWAGFGYAYEANTNDAIQRDSTHEIFVRIGF
ncbi:PorP/SprF family type IX secretion system membrane protein [Sungkyunkwania multivorans]|uniref:PorP/SprF family type IX secretion system membrane protein n=1 Tax=Sungkyunkwania multivorans TaxID=1173618 RepID=A0ABW3CUG4_9FLAO